MPSKTEEYLALAQRTANGLTRYWESWTDYLTTASRLYKYPFADQLMIPCQTTVAVRREHLPCRTERGRHPPPDEVPAPGRLSAAGHYHPHGGTSLPSGYGKL